MRRAIACAPLLGYLEAVVLSACVLAGRRISPEFKFRSKFRVVEEEGPNVNVHRR